MPWRGLPRRAYEVGEARHGTGELAAIEIVLVIAILWRPELLDRIPMLKLLGVEVALNKLRTDSAKQRKELDDIRFVLTMLLGGHEMST
jgi:hypothetical protein